MKSKKPSVLGIEYEEKVLYKKSGGSKLERINSRWEYGIFVGARRKSNEIMVMNMSGLFKVRSVRRIPFEKRWTEDSLTWVCWAPWHRCKDREDQDGELPEWGAC